MLGNLGFEQEARPLWGGRTGKTTISVHIPDIRRLTEEEMKERN